METGRELWEKLQEIKKKIEAGEVRDSSHFFFVELQKLIFQLWEELTLKPNEPVVDLPPRVDLLFKSKNGFNVEHRKRLPDGIAQSKAHEILIEFKNTQPFNDENLKQPLNYHELFRKKHGLTEQDLETFLVLCMTPHKRALEEYGYKQSLFNGVYRSLRKPWDVVCILVANELAETPNNAPIMLFASISRKREKAYQMLMESDLFPKTSRFKNFLAFLRAIWSFGKSSQEGSIQNFSFEEIQMNVEEFVSGLDFQEFYRIFGDSYLDAIPIQQRMEKIKNTFTPQDLKDVFMASDAENRRDIVKNLGVEDRREVIKTLDAEDRREVVRTLDAEDRREVIKTLDAEDRREVVRTLDAEDLREVVKTLDAEDRREVVKTLDAEDRREVVRTLDLEERLDGLSPEQIEFYLAQKKKTK